VCSFQDSLGLNLKFNEIIFQGGRYIEFVFQIGEILMVF